MKQISSAESWTPSGANAPLTRKVAGEPATKMTSDALRREATRRSWSSDFFSLDLLATAERLSWSTSLESSFSYSLIQTMYLTLVCLQIMLIE